MPPIKVRKTAVEKKKGIWDGPKAVADAASSAAVLEHMHAWRSTDDAVEKKSAYKFTHHLPGDDSPAVLEAVNLCLARLPQAEIPDGDRPAVEAHLRAHRKDAGLAETLSEAEIDAAVKFIKDVDDLKVEEAKQLTEAIRIQEARNTAEWLESRLHLSLTQIADDLFGYGNITRDERKALSAAIGVALDAYHQSMADNCPQLFKRSPWDYPPEDTSAVSEGVAASPVTLREEFTPITEKALRRDGSIPIKIIQPGWGSSGYYDPVILERDGARAFPTGAKMFWNHPSTSEESDRPERDLDDLAAELISPARYEENGPKGPGLYADAKVFDAYREAVDSLAGSIGLSIRASGKAKQGSAEGRNGPIITALIEDEMNTVDFVTYPGAGGEVITMFEAARTVRTDKKTEAGAVPVTGATGVAITESQTEDDMELKALQEAVAALQKSDVEKTAENSRLQEALAFRDAKDMVREALENLQQLPAVTRSRLLENLPKQMVTKEGKLDTEAFGKVIDETVKAEIKYLSEAAGLGNIRDLGESHSEDEADAPEKVEESLEASFSAMGMKETSAKIAAAGRG